jgi:hypothetical protein
MNFKILTGAAFIGALLAFSVALTLTNHATAAPPATVRDGSHDFSFIYGKWRMPNQGSLPLMVQNSTLGPLSNNPLSGTALEDEGFREFATCGKAWL